MHIVALVLAAVFMTGTLLAGAPVREPDNGQIVIAANVKNLPAVAAKTNSSSTNSSWIYQLDKSPSPYQRELQSQNPVQEWQKKNELECFLDILPDTDEAELESAMEDTANCFKCPRLCGYFHHRNSSDEADLNPPFLHPDSDMTIHIPAFFPTLNPNGGTNQ